MIEKINETLSAEVAAAIARHRLYKDGDMVVLREGVQVGTGDKVYKIQGAFPFRTRDREDQYSVCYHVTAVGETELVFSPRRLPYLDLLEDFVQLESGEVRHRSGGSLGREIEEALQRAADAFEECKQEEGEKYVAAHRELVDGELILDMGSAQGDKGFLWQVVSAVATEKSERGFGFDGICYEIRRCGRFIYSDDWISSKYFASIFLSEGTGEEDSVWTNDLDGFVRACDVKYCCVEKSESFPCFQEFLRKSLAEARKEHVEKRRAFKDGATVIESIEVEDEGDMRSLRGEGVEISDGINHRVFRVVSAFVDPEGANIFYELECIGLFCWVKRRSNAKSVIAIAWCVPPENKFRRNEWQLAGIECFQVIDLEMTQRQ